MPQKPIELLKEIAFANGANVVNRPTNFLLAIPSSYLPAAKKVSLAVAYGVVQMDAPHVAKAGKPVAWLTSKVRSSIVAKVVPSSCGSFGCRSSTTEAQGGTANRPM
ncbi:uncharacterized protein BO96DRAFT_339975 [Aspergillus niger CBS 101883]|uniref:Uncharacterized protein n=2 Tax=Aspergillus niger TaxID=5061 RepID=A2QYU9_ASPNC|nr:uncharacterized protein BO96DRAFT_339975 [Aspergillus niger CBS 101883]XP_059601815.1 hypothetical protein An12g02580 [Aspergillus niger]PYH55714.1 hypothetical protein BO96DRAFT_339975 [Aspergillus niger CBS 101883]CAK41098.1 hypothetical protein An12g02580 [Aspergillus niger]